MHKALERYDLPTVTVSCYSRSSWAQQVRQASFRDRFRGITSWLDDQQALARCCVTSLRRSICHQITCVSRYFPDSVCTGIYGVGYSLFSFSDRLGYTGTSFRMLTRWSVKENTSDSSWPFSLSGCVTNFGACRTLAD